MMTKIKFIKLIRVNGHKNGWMMKSLMIIQKSMIKMMMKIQKKTDPLS